MQTSAENSPHRGRVLYLTIYYPPFVGGAAHTAYHISQRLAEHGYEVHVVVPNIIHPQRVDSYYGESEIAKELSKKKRGRVRVIRLKIPIPRPLSPILAGLELARKEAELMVKYDYDFIIVQYIPGYLITPFTLLIAKIFRVPVVFRTEDILRDIYPPAGLRDLLRFKISRFLNSLNENMLRYASKVTVVCSELRGLLLRRRPNLDPDKVCIMPNGVSLSEVLSLAGGALSEGREDEDLREALGIPEGAKVILFVGSYSRPEYGVKLLIEAMNYLKREADLPRATLVLVGDKPPEDLMSLVSRLDVAHEVLFIRPQPRDRVLKLISIADICIGPLYPTVAIPLKILEYFSLGKPVLTGRGSVSHDLLSPGVNAEVCDPDPRDISAKLVRLLKDTPYREYLGKNARKTVEEYDWDVIVRKFLEKCLEFT